MLQVGATGINQPNRPLSYNIPLHVDSDCAITEIQPLTSLTIQMIKGYFTEIIIAVVLKKIN
jgi:hypothetical protein